MNVDRLADISLSVGADKLIQAHEDALRSLIIAAYRAGAQEERAECLKICQLFGASDCQSAIQQRDVYVG